MSFFENVGISCILLVINSALSIAIRYFAQFELHGTKTNENISISKKLGVAQFVNTALIIFFVNYYQNGKQVAINGGLNFDLISLILSSIFITPILTIFSPAILFKTLLRLYYSTRPHLLTQEKANILWEEPKLDIADR